MRIGIIGDGQLAMMSIMEGLMMDIDFAVLSFEGDSPASYVTKHVFKENEVEEFAAFSDVITYEFEHFDKKIFGCEKLLDKLYPGVKPIELKQNRLLEKKFLKDHNFPVVPFYEAKNADELFEVVESLNKEVVVKTISNGYDGKGQYVIHTRDDLELLRNRLKDSKDTFLVEEFCYFDFEMSLIAGVSKDRIVFMPMTKNIHKNGILLYNHTDVFTNEVQEKAKAITSRLLKALDIKKGVLAVEFFVKAKDVYINEFAPRVHNTGHHTLNDAEYSQFELLLRTMLDMPIHSPSLITQGGMINIIGNINLTKELKDSILSLEGASLYWYRKTPREGRKLGHINVVGKDVEEVKVKLRNLSKLLYPSLNIW
jgi:Phosphoribosylaminoimidazole carboxylase (NCAIR synthetase)